jgi:hypothetical protein
LFYLETILHNIYSTRKLYWQYLFHLETRLHNNYSTRKITSLSVKLKNLFGCIFPLLEILLCNYKNWAGFELTTLVVISTGCTCSCKSLNIERMRTIQIQIQIQMCLFPIKDPLRAKLLQWLNIWVQCVMYTHNTI